MKNLRAFWNSLHPKDTRFLHLLWFFQLLKSMEGLQDSTAVTDTVSSTIPGPYINPERTESIPLKGKTPSSNFFARCCRNCIGFADDEAGDGLKVIIITFFILSAAVTVALVAQIYQGDFQVIPHGSVATDSENCSKIGTDMLKKSGNAVDAAVASTLCMGVVNPHITGLGGGGFMLVYDHRRSAVLESMDFREAAPRSFPGPTPGLIGAKSVGVPGLVSGLFAVHKAHGRLPWQEVVKPAADIARSGFLVSRSLVAARSHLGPRSSSNAMLHDLVDTLDAGQTLKLPVLADTLELIANEGPDAFYNGSISKEILAATQGSSLTTADLSNYAPMQRESLHESFYGFDVIVPGAPSGGPLLLAALKSINALNLTGFVAEGSTPLLLLKQAQAIQQNYPDFFLESGDPDFSSVTTSGKTPSPLPETVSSHVAAVDLNDLYVSVVSGHNSLFGSQIMTGAGFILNNALASFDSSNSDKPANSASVLEGQQNPSAPVMYLDSPHSVPGQRQQDYIGNPSSQPSFEQAPLQRSKRDEAGPRATVWGSSVANNGLAGGKRPISLATPIIAVERGQICGRRLILGGSDASIAAQVLSQLVVLDENLTSSIEFPRVRLNPSGSTLSLEESYASHLSPAIRQRLADLGLQMQPQTAVNPSVNIIEKIGDTLASHSDSRGEGQSSRF